MATVVKNPDGTYTVTPTPEEAAIVARDPQVPSRLPDVIAAAATRAIESVHEQQRVGLQKLYPALTDNERGRVDTVLAEAQARIAERAAAVEIEGKIVPEVTQP